jgi:FkbM family methyltransferase
MLATQTNRVRNFLRSVYTAFNRVNFGLALRLVTLQAARSTLAIPGRFSFSQTGEDLILSFYLQEGIGFYIDVGANDPVKYSNTFALYLRGWHGIAIEANESLSRRYKSVRKRDICVNAALSDTEFDAIFHRCEAHEVSTIDTATYEERRLKWNFRPQDQIEVRTKTLTSVLLEVLPKAETQIDLLSIDVEGHELQVLRGLDFKLYRPRVIVVEMHDLRSVLVSDLSKLLEKEHYSLLGFVTMNAYFIDGSHTT